MRNPLPAADVVVVGKSAQKQSSHRKRRSRQIGWVASATLGVVASTSLLHSAKGAIPTISWAGTIDGNLGNVGNYNSGDPTVSSVDFADSPTNQPTSCSINVHDFYFDDQLTSYNIQGDGITVANGGNLDSYQSILPQTISVTTLTLSGNAPLLGGSGGGTGLLMRCLNPPDVRRKFGSAMASERLHAEG